MPIAPFVVAFLILLLSCWQRCAGHIAGLLLSVRSEFSNLLDGSCNSFMHKFFLIRFISSSEWTQNMDWLCIGHTCPWLCERISEFCSTIFHIFFFAYIEKVLFFYTAKECSQFESRRYERMHTYTHEIGLFIVFCYTFYLIWLYDYCSPCKSDRLDYKRFGLLIVLQMLLSTFIIRMNGLTRTRSTIRLHTW